MFKGSIVALVTPFVDDEVDTDTLRELVEFHISEGTHAIVAAGTTGEAATLSFQEKLDVIKTVVSQAKERIPVIAGTAMNATRDCIHLTLEAMHCGAHAALVMTPAYIKPTQEGLYLHYQQLAESVAIPIILYNVPSRTACDLLPETVGRLSKFSNIIGIKEATGDMSRLQQILRLCGDTMDIYSGDDLTAVHWLLAGAKGVISVTANVVPRQMAKLSDAALDNDYTTCLEINEHLMPLHELMFVEANPIPVKWALSKMARLENELRLPLTPLSTKYQAALEAVLKQLDCLPRKLALND